MDLTAATGRLDSWALKCVGHSHVPLGSSYILTPMHMPTTFAQVQSDSVLFTMLSTQPLLSHAHAFHGYAANELRQGHWGGLLVSHNDCVHGGHGTLCCGE
jgi:hypothetical protein